MYLSGSEVKPSIMLAEKCGTIIVIMEYDVSIENINVFKFSAENIMFMIPFTRTMYV